MVDRKLLRLEVNAGLCNRLRALIAGICWAEKLGRNLVVYWPSFKPECAAAFEDLFLEGCLPNFVRVVDYYLENPQSCLQAPDAVQIFGDNSADCYDIKSHGKFWNGDESLYLGYLRYLMPNLKVQEILHEWDLKGLSSTSVAIHIRRTDNEKAIRLSPFDVFMKCILEQPGPVAVFSDDAAVVQALRQAFGQKILSFESIRQRNTLEGMQEAAAVFFALSKKQTIYGSANSSFSEIARDYGNSSLFILRT